MTSGTIAALVTDLSSISRGRAVRRTVTIVLLAVMAALLVSSSLHKRFVYDEFDNLSYGYRFLTTRPGRAAPGPAHARPRRSTRSAAWPTVATTGRSMPARARAWPCARASMVFALAPRAAALRLGTAAVRPRRRAGRPVAGGVRSHAARARQAGDERRRRRLLHDRGRVRLLAMAGAPARRGASPPARSPPRAPSLSKFTGLLLVPDPGPARGRRSRPRLAGGTRPTRPRTSRAACRRRPRSRSACSRSSTPPTSSAEASAWPRPIQWESAAFRTHVDLAGPGAPAPRVRAGPRLLELPAGDAGRGPRLQLRPRRAQPRRPLVRLPVDGPAQDAARRLRAGRCSACAHPARPAWARCSAIPFAVVMVFFSLCVRPAARDPLRAAGAAVPDPRRRARRRRSPRLSALAGPAPARSGRRARRSRITRTSFPYFNELIGRRVNAYRYLADSNLDWEDHGYSIEEFQRRHPEMSITIEPARGKPVPGWILVGANGARRHLRAGAVPLAARGVRSRDRHVAYSHLLYYIPPDRMRTLPAPRRGRRHHRRRSRTTTARAPSETSAGRDQRRRRPSHLDFVGAGGHAARPTRCPSATTTSAVLAVDARAPGRKNVRDQTTRAGAGAMTRARRRVDVSSTTSADDGQRRRPGRRRGDDDRVRPRIEIGPDLPRHDVLEGHGGEEARGHAHRRRRPLEPMDRRRRARGQHGHRARTAPAAPRSATT